VDPTALGFNAEEVRNVSKGWPEDPIIDRSSSESKEIRRLSGVVRRSFVEEDLPASSYNDPKSSQIRSSLDVIEDTQMAVDSYFEHSVAPQSGDCYTKVYGILQALVVQQDAVKHLFEALDCPYQLSPDLKNIREIRNRACGHPTKLKRKRLSFHFISRATLSQEGFQLISEVEGFQDAFEEVKVSDLFDTQGRELMQLLIALVKSLEPLK
jgi:hypothetical protein